MKDSYNISKESLNRILQLAGAMYEVGEFIVEEHRDKCDTFRSDVLCDGVICRLDKNYEEMKKLVKVVCNDGKLNE